MIYTIKSLLVIFKIKAYLHKMKRHPVLYSSLKKELSKALRNAKTNHEKETYFKLLRYWERLTQ